MSGIFRSLHGLAAGLRFGPVPYQRKNRRE